MNFENAVLGLELGSTRIKAVVLDENHVPVASGSFEWENQLVNGIWTYDLDTVHRGMQSCYADLKRDIREKFGVTPVAFGAIGISGMMHGYLPFDGDDRLLCPFRTWRNTMTGEAAEKLTALFHFNIPQRWSIAHLYQAMLNGEAHLPQLRFLTTLAGYIHLRLTGEKVLGIGEASGMFPMDSDALDYRQDMAEQFDGLIAQMGYGWKLRQVLPRVLPAGADAGRLTESGAAFLDPDGDLRPGILFAPPEGDAGTGMTATNSVRVRTGNVSAGTSDFAMVVVEKMPGVHREIDMVTTPAGKPVAMVHCNNCTSDINAWVNLLDEFAKVIGSKIDKGELFVKLFHKALEGDADCGGLMAFNYFSGEGITDLDEGRPVFARTPAARFTLANFMRAHIMSALATLKLGMDILINGEQVKIDKLYGHGGFFKTPGVGQRMLSAAVKAPVSVMETAGEGGPYGMALLAAYRLHQAAGETLEDYLDEKVFANAKASTLMADAEEMAGFDRFTAVYAAALPMEKAAIAALREE